MIADDAGVTQQEETEGKESYGQLFGGARQRMGCQRSAFQSLHLALLFKIFLAEHDRSWRGKKNCRWRDRGRVT